MSNVSMWKFRSSLIAAVAAASLSTTLHAQGTTMYQVNVPFAFESGSQHFETGTYKLSADPVQHMLMIKGAQRTRYTLTGLQPDSEAGDTSKVVFEKYGDQYFMHDLYIAGASAHVHCVKSQEEKRAEKQEERAANALPASGVEIALKALSR